MGIITSLPSEIRLANVGDTVTEAGTAAEIVGHSGTTTVNFDSSVISVSSSVGGSVPSGGTLPALDFNTTVGPLTVTAVGEGSTVLEFVSQDTSVAPTVSIPVTVGAVEDESYLNKRGLTHFWDNIDDLKQDKLTAGTNITISANNTISASQPTVGNATLTIQKNGTNVQTFTANATSNKTANITVPTTVAELSDSSNYATTTDLAAKQNLLSPGSHISITSDVISATGYVHSENPQAAAAASSTITGSMIASGTITADKLATGATVQLTLSSSDIGEGAPLAANTLYGVYI